MSYRVTIVDDEGMVLDVVNIDGYDLSRSQHQGDLGERIADGMGRTHVAACAARTTEEEIEDDATER